MDQEHKDTPTETQNRQSSVDSRHKNTKKEVDIEISASWAEVEDPDTGEIFYWNEETHEVRWEI